MIGAEGFSILRKGTRVRLIALLFAAVGLLSSFAAPADAGYTPRAANMYSGPSYYYKVVATTLSGWSVRMNCWIDTPYWSYGTNRWFHISAYGWSPYTGRGGYFSGFVSANQVAPQQTVRRC